MVWVRRVAVVCLGFLFVPMGAAFAATPTPSPTPSVSAQADADASGDTPDMVFDTTRSLVVWVAAGAVALTAGAVVLLRR